MCEVTKIVLPSRCNSRNRSYARLGIEPGGGFVEHEKRWIVNDRAAQAHALFHPARESANHGLPFRLEP